MNDWTFIEEPQKPADSGLSAAPRASGDFEFVTEDPAAKSAPKRTIPEIAKDVGISAAVEAGKSIPGVIIGGAGSLEKFAVEEAPKALRDLAITGGEKLDLLSPAEAERMRQAPPQWLPNQTEMQKKGHSSPLFHYPTYKGVTEGIKELAPKLGAPIMAREPETPAGKIASETVKGGAMGLPGLVRGTIGRVAAGAAAGAAGEVAGQINKDQPNEPFWRLVGALGGGLAGAKAANTILPSIKGRDELAEAMGKDFSTKQARMTPEEIRRAIDEGREVSIMDMAGPNTMAYISKSAGTSNLNVARSQEFNSALLERAASSGNNIHGTISNAFGRNIDADAYTQALEEAGKKTRNQVFGLARANPVADAIPESVFTSSIGGRSPLMGRPAIEEAIKGAEKNIRNMSESFDIRPPKSTPGTPGTETKWVAGPRGLEEVPGTPAIPAVYTPGNLSYWHQVDRELGAMIKSAQKDPEKAAQVVGLQETQRDLRAAINSVVPEYGKAIGTSAKTFQGENAPEAGYNFANTIFGAAKNPFNRGEVRREFESMPPENREAFSVGVAHFLSQKALSGGVDQLAKKFANDNVFRDDLRAVLGPERYHQIAGSVMTEDILRKMPAVQPSGTPVSSLTAFRVGAGATVVWDNLPVLLTNAKLPPDLMFKAVMVGMLGAGASSIHKAGERRVAEAIVPLVFSRKPEDVAKLSRIAEESPVVRRMFSRLTTVLNVAQQQQRERAEREDQRPARATGGAVNLKALARLAKKTITQSSESLLQKPDEHVARALAIAGREI
jgi:hypothetical protein